MSRVLVFDESPVRAEILREGLALAGHEVVAMLDSALDLIRQVDSLEPDVIIVHTDSPTRDVLEHIVMISRDRPRPIVMFASDAGSETIREAVRAGVSAYVVDGLDAARIQPIIEVAVARFDAFQSLKTELAAATDKLAERKLVERAKGILMKQRGMSEDAAYNALRKLAMDRNKRLADVAQQLIDMAELLT
jgi:two-component system, response regulator / RNA-binding antiterminator